MEQNEFCFTLKPSEAICVLRERLRQDLNGDGARQLRVPCAVDLAHAARAERREAFIRAETNPR